VQQLISVIELADWLHLPVKTLYAWRRAGTGPPSFRAGKEIRYRVADVDNWMSERIAADQEKRR